MNRAQGAVMAIIMAAAGHALAETGCTTGPDCAKALASKFVDQSKSPMERLAALQKLRAIDPTLADKFEPTRQTLLPLAERQHKEFTRKIDAAMASKSGPEVTGVRIGMTVDQVRKSELWARPERINKTVTARGTREQWVYGGGRYLYLENGIVTTIQSPW